jgi:hypothetical protein
MAGLALKAIQSNWAEAAGSEHSPCGPAAGAIVQGTAVARCIYKEYLQKKKKNTARAHTAHMVPSNSIQIKEEAGGHGEGGAMVREVKTGAK